MNIAKMHYSLMQKIIGKLDKGKRLVNLSRGHGKMSVNHPEDLKAKMKPNPREASSPSVE